MHFLDIKHGLALSIGPAAGRPDGGERGNIDFPATYALFVCTDTLARNLVKCELHHLSLCAAKVCVSENLAIHAASGCVTVVLRNAMFQATQLCCFTRLLLEVKL